MLEIKPFEELRFTDDFMFKSVLTQKENKPILIRMLTTILGIEVIDIEYVNTEVSIQRHYMN